MTSNPLFRAHTHTYRHHTHTHIAHHKTTWAFLEKALLINWWKRPFKVLNIKIFKMLFSLRSNYFCVFYWCEIDLFWIVWSRTVKCYFVALAKRNRWNANLHLKPSAGNKKKMFFFWSRKLGRGSSFGCGFRLLLLLLFSMLIWQSQKPKTSKFSGD